MKEIYALLTITALSALGGCASIVPNSENNYAIVRTFFATDRTLIKQTKTDAAFGTDRSKIRYGVADVAIPRDHRMGELESPAWYRFEFWPDPGKHVMLLSTKIEPKEHFLSNLAEQVRLDPSRSAFLFVHGYHVTFEDAALRTAQMAYDLKFQGAAVFYSWPSQGSYIGYPQDEENVAWAQKNLENFLEDFFSHSNADKIYLIAHSMGSRALTTAIASLIAKQPSLRARLAEIILAAPDIDSAIFKRDIAPALAATARPVTLYSSSNDMALYGSAKFHGNPRAGDSGQGLIVAPGIETVDATSIDTSLIGHSYYGDTRSMLSDMYELIHDGKRADQRFGLRPAVTPAGRYWEFAP